MQNPHSNSAQEALDQLEQAFSQWRQQKTYSQAKIPEDLLKKAAELSHHFDDLSIRKRLGITDRQLNRIKSLKNDQTHTDQSLSFVELPNSLDTLQAQDPMNITISLPNGLSINISGFGSQPVTAIIERLLKQSESNPC